MGNLTQANENEGVGNRPLFSGFIVKLIFRKMHNQYKEDLTDFILIIVLLAVVCSPLVLHYL